MTTNLNPFTMHRSLSILLLLFLCALMSPLVAQFNETGVNRHEATNVVPPSPTAAAFAQYGNFPVNMANGVANVSIPLHTVQGDGISLPISLSYHGSGIKVDQISSWVGLGWSLNAGGVVTRSVVGKPDELLDGYMYTAANIVYPFEPSGAAFAALESIANGYQDAQPDQFNFNIGGYSGSFFFSGPDEIQLIPQQDLRIETFYGAPGEPYIDAFKITTPDGVQYYFDQKEFSNMDKVTTTGGSSCNTLYADPNEFAPTSWYLSKIYNPNTKDSITLAYQSHTIEYDLAYFANHTIKHLINDGTACSNNNQYCAGYSIKTEHGLHLTTITSKYGSVNLVPSSGRSDLKSVSGGDNRLSELQIKGAQNGLLKKYVFTQAFTESTDPLGSSIHPHRKYRMYLESVQELGASGGAKPAYTFSYKDRDLLPARLSFGQDHWGYFNGADNDVMIPASNYEGIVYGGLSGLVGADREPNPVVCDYGLLDAITYPTGGATSFAYEAHQYTASETVPEVASFDSGIIYAEPTCDEFQTVCEVYTESAPFTLTNVQNALLYRKLQKPTTENGGPPSTPLPDCGIKRFDNDLDDWVNVPLAGNYPFTEDPGGLTVSGVIWNAQGSTNLPLELEDGEYKLWAKSGQGWSNATIQLWCDYETGNQIYPEIIVGGARIQEMSSASSASEAAIVKTYDYEPFYFTGISNYNYERLENYRVIESTPGGGGSTNCLLADCQQLKLTSNVANSSSPSNPVAYVRVSEVQPGNGRTDFEYSMMFNSPPTYTEHPDNVYLNTPWTDNSWGRGRMLHQRVFSEAGVLLQEQINTYDFNNTTNAYEGWGMNARRIRDLVGCQFAFAMMCDGDPNNDTYQACYKGDGGFLGIYVVGASGDDCFTLETPCFGHLNEEVIANWNALDDYAFEYYRLRSRRVTLEQSQSIQYDENGLNPITITTDYTYGPDHLNPLQIVTTSGDISQTVDIKYAHESTGGAWIAEMLNRNMVSIPLETTVTGTVQSAGKTIYTIHEDMILPLRFYQQRGSSGLQLTGSLSYTNNDPFPDSYLKANYTNPEVYTWYPAGSPKEGLLASKTYIDWVEDFDYDPNSRQMIFQRAVDEQEVNFSYDEFQRLALINARGGNMQTQFAYNYGGSNSVRSTTAFGDGTPTQDSYEYFDGLGRFTHTLAKNYTPAGADKVMKSAVYDEQGRVSEQYAIGQGTTTFAYEPSPLNRMKTTYPEIGDIQVAYLTNQEVIGIYSPATLHQQNTIDENGNLSSTYTDVLGRTIMSRQYVDNANVDTYYEYDIYGNIASVTNPIGEQYLYTYDALNRLQTKAIPGMTGVHTYAYYANDLMKSSIDPNGNELYYEYDDYDRVLTTRLGGAGGEIQVQNLYDDDGNPGSASKGKLTGTHTRVLGGQLLQTNMVYDGYGRVQSTTSQNHIGGQDVLTSTYNDADNILNSVHTHNGFENYTISRTYEFDHSFRMRKADFQLDAHPVFTLSRHHYNSEDQLVVKSLYGPDATHPLQKIDYAYNSRGWLTHINEVPTGGDDVLIPDCATTQPPECGPACDYTATITGVGIEVSYPIIGIYVQGDVLMDLNYPMHAPFTNLQTEIEQWLSTNGYAYDTVVITANHPEYTIDVIQSKAVLNKIVQYNPTGEDFETYFEKSNCADTPEPPSTICELCERDGYPCDRCPYWEIEEPCTTCQYLNLADCNNCDYAVDICTRCTNLGYADCTSCPLTVAKVRPLKVQVEYDHSLLAAAGSSPVLVRVTESAYAYQHDGTVRAHKSQNMAVIGQGALTALGTNNYPNIMEIDLSDQWINQGTFDTVIELAENQLAAELTSAGITDTNVQADFVQSVMQQAAAGWAGTTDQDIPGGGYVENPDLFSMELYYNESHPMVSSPVQLNGNISGMVWKTGFGAVQSYSFEYDAINRLKTGLYRDDLGGGNYATDNKYGVSLSYDAAGNIQTLMRRGVDDICEDQANNTLYEFTQIDNLAYSYTNSRLNAITESSNPDHGYKGTGGSFSYDSNGNMTQDGNKQMSIAYNHLNLPNQINFSGSNNLINFTYDAAGAKLQKVSSGVEADGTVVDDTKDYVAGIEYKNSAVEAIYHEEGRVVFDEEGSPVYEYYLKDHLGNVRVVFSDLNNNGYLEPFTLNPDDKAPEEGYTELLQENHYYPFGMEMEGAWELSVGLPENRYLFNGIEHESDFGLGWDMADFRCYDASIGRWLQIDPLAEFGSAWTPYRFGFDNPISYTDPDGLFETKKDAKKWARKNGVKTGWFTNGRIKKSSDGTYRIDVSDSKTGVITSTSHDPETAELLGAQSNGDGTVTSIAISPTDRVQTGENSLFTISGWYLRDGSLSMPDMPRPSYGPPATKVAGTTITVLSSGSKFTTVTNSVNTVYHSVKNGVTQYVGITNNLARRTAEQLTSKGISIEPLMRNLSRSDARAVEQTLIEIHGLSKNGGTLLNKINSISPKRDIYKKQLQRGYDLLKSIGYQ